jgi:hypothetical protein
MRKTKSAILEAVLETTKGLHDAGVMEEHGLKVEALRHGLIKGENSDEARELDLKKIKAEARQRSGE